MRYQRKREIISGKSATHVQHDLPQRCAIKCCCKTALRYSPSLQAMCELLLGAERLPGAQPPAGPLKSDLLHGADVFPKMFVNHADLMRSRSRAAKLGARGKPSTMFPRGWLV